MTPSADCYELIKHFEGLQLKAYKCPADVWTIGYGCTAGVTEGMVITKEEAEARLRNEVNGFADRVNGMVTVEITQSMFDALTSFSYNVGTDALRRSTLLRKLNIRDFDGAANEFSRWTRGGGKVLPGLVRRRLAEAQLFKGEAWQT